MTSERLEKPACRFGYTDEQLARILGPRLSAFNKWMTGQTVAGCEGKPPCTEAHGMVVYPGDLQGFLNGRAIWD